MKNIYIGILGLLALTVASSSCTKVRMTEAEKEREAWVESFDDSIAFYKHKTAEIEVKLGEINADMASLLDDFEMVNNPKEVEGYYILKGWQSKLPLTSTGIIARINQGEKLELIATLAGATFNQIEIGNCRSEVVKHDQAFNYRHKTYNTVYFSGDKADSIAEYIAIHKNEALKLNFLEGGVKKSFALTDADKNMISKTWNLYWGQKESHELQKEMWMCSKKIETFRRLRYMEE